MLRAFMRRRVDKVSVRVPRRLFDCAGGHGAILQHIVMVSLLHRIGIRSSSNFRNQFAGVSLLHMNDPESSPYS
ncbi:hypothetical protein FOMPIDRAFT_161023 [Fomitopsis schrenkii]|uniref:Uncharacterized protein n=1 Tax=Fomitopsis schrenkii TaxID=2126942 RepID=S8EG18_FOMSC|nr:hypothetical protein FOMPIDRAFT_161023 [Fomitopsis schrenkii]